MTDELDEINQILMCFEKYSWKEFGEHYPVTNQKSMNRTEAKQAINAYILGEVMELIGEDETPEIPVNDYHWRIRNELRQKLRTKLKDYFGEIND